MTDPSVRSVDGRRVLVTGGTGFVGRHLVRLLVEKGADVHVITTDAERARHRLQEIAGGLPTTIHEGRLDSVAQLSDVVTSSAPEMVFHLAAFAHAGRAWNEAGACMRVNVEGTANLLAAIGETPTEVVVHTSTAAVYGNGSPPFSEAATPRPTSPYAISKLAAEQLCASAAQQFGFDLVQLRLFNVYGPGQPVDRIIPDVITHGLGRTPIEMTSGEQTREFNYVGDVVEAIARAATTPAAFGSTINVGGGDEISIADLARTVLQKMGDPVRPRIGAIDARPAEMMRVCADAERAASLLGWRASTPLSAGLEQTIDWYAARQRSEPAAAPAD